MRYQVACGRLGTGDEKILVMIFSIPIGVAQRSRLCGVIAVFSGILFMSCGGESAPAPQTQKSTSTTTAPGAVGSVQLGGVERIDSVMEAQTGRWVLVNVWATWCRPCVAETPDLVALHQALGEKPFSLIGISADYMTAQSPDEALKKVREFGIHSKIQYPNIIFSGSTDELTARFALGGTIPTSILYDPQGRETERWVGKFAESDLARISSLVP